MKVDQGRDGFFGTALVKTNKEYDYLDTAQETLGYYCSYSTWVIPSSHENRADLISYLFYNTPSLWRIIAQFNHVEDPFTEFEAGRVLKIPDIADVARFHRDNYRDDEFKNMDFDRRRFDQSLRFKDSVVSVGSISAGWDDSNWITVTKVES